jgi:hypothetical protein
MSNEIQTVDPSAKLSLEQIAEAVPEAYREKVVGLFRLLDPSESKLELGDLDTSRYVYRPPMIRIKQAMSQTNLPVKNGDLYSADTGEIYDRPLKLIPIFTWENRMKFGQGTDKELCISEDKEHSINGLECATCLDRPWRDKQRQECNDFLHFLFVTPDFGKMFKIGYSGASAKAGRNIISQCMSSGENLWTRFYDLNTEEVKGPKGNYYVATTVFTGSTPKEIHFAGAALNKALKKARLAMKYDLATKLAENSVVVANAMAGNGTGAPATNMKDFANL